MHEKLDDESVNKAMYQSAVGSQLYLMTRIHPDIAFAVNSVACFLSDPTKQH